MQLDGPEADPGVELIIRRVTELVDARILALKQDLTEHFGVRHDELTRRMAELEERLEQATKNFDRWAVGIQRNTAFTKHLAQGAFADTSQPPAPLTPEANAPCPIEIDQAARAGPSEGEQRVDLPEYGAVLYIAPGEDPDKAWAGTKAALRKERGASGVRRSPRTRGR